MEEELKLRDYTSLFLQRLVNWNREILSERVDTLKEIRDKVEKEKLHDLMRNNKDLYDTIQESTNRVYGILTQLEKGLGLEFTSLVSLFDAMSGVHELAFEIENLTIDNIPL